MSAVERRRMELRARKQDQLLAIFKRYEQEVIEQEACVSIHLQCTFLSQHLNFKYIFGFFNISQKKLKEALKRRAASDEQKFADMMNELGMDFQSFPPTQHFTLVFILTRYRLSSCNLRTCCCLLLLLLFSAREAARRRHGAAARRA
jgi:hypothetical protein